MSTPPAIAVSAPLKPNVESNTPPRKNPAPLSAFLEPVSRATHFEKPGLVAFRNEHFHGAFGAHLGEVFGDPGQRLAAHHVRDGQSHAPTTVQERQQRKRSHLKSQSEHQRESKPCACSQPPANEIRDDSKNLIQQEEDRELDRRVAKLVKMQQYQQAQCTIGEREGPVRRGDNRVVAGADLPAHRNESPSFMASSTIRLT
jgi:hypothetical protein